jgi:hypothetical protein
VIGKQLRERLGAIGANRVAASSGEQDAPAALLSRAEA